MKTAYAFAGLIWTASLASIAHADTPTAVEGGGTGAQADSNAPIASSNLPSIAGPDSVDGTLHEENRPKSPLLKEELFKDYFDFKKGFYDETGISFGFDYSASYFKATDELNDDEAGGGMLRIYGAWEVFGRGEENTGKLIYKVEHRHRYTTLAPSSLSLDLGSTGVMEAPFSNQGWRLTNLYWRQSFSDNRYVVMAGFLDATDYVDAYALASPWMHFANLAFSTGSGTIGLPNDATLGIAAGAWITDNIYVLGGLTDLNADPTDPFEGFNTFFNDHEYFKSLEFGWTSSRDRAYLDNVHVTVWHSDEIESAGVNDGWGVNFSASTWIDEKWMPFLRGGYSNDGGSLLEASVSAGIGYQGVPGRDLLGFAINWGKPNEDTLGGGLGDQYVSELFYRWQLTQHTAITPSVQLLVNPAANPDEDVIGVFGIRFRTTF